MRICVIPGDGIGAEVIPAALQVLEACQLPLEVVLAEAGWATFQNYGTALPDATIAAARAADAILFGAVASPSFPVPGYRSPIVALRRTLDLYANLRPVAGVGRKGEPLDLLVVRENTEGLYAGRERVEDQGNTAIAERVITRNASARIVRMAFELAQSRAAANPGHTPKVTIVHKANVLRETCGLFRKVALEVAATYPAISHDELLVDNCALQLVQHPERFDVIVTTNLFGDIVSDVASYWSGGLGVATSTNLGEHYALFEPVHGAAPDIAGQGIANPLAALGCLADLLAYLAGRSESGTLRTRLSSSAEQIAVAVAHVRSTGPYTPDLGGSATTTDIVQAVIATL